MNPLRFLIVGTFGLTLMTVNLHAQAKLTASEFAPTGMVGSVVGISVDPQGRVYVTQTQRRTHGALDIRKYRDWIPRTLAAQSTEDKRSLIREEFDQGSVGDANNDGTIDWQDLLIPSEQVLMLEDTDQDGLADRKFTVADNFSTEITGLAGSVLVHDGSVYTTIIPDLWRLDDLDGDGLVEERTSLATGFGLHVGYGGHDMHGLALGPDGKIYWSIGDKAFSVTHTDGKHAHYPYHGAILRCDPSGSNFEVFAKGLRNPQEPMFDDLGNLFVVDNDSDFGDREGFRYILEGSDSGWRTMHQYRAKEGYNVWTDEELWRPHFHPQAAYITPCIVNFSEGPAGFAYNPGTALSEALQGHFFLAEFPGKRLQAFQAIPTGAGFTLANPGIVHQGHMLVGINFGPDGALYGADWGENKWVPHQKGRILRLDVAEQDRHPLRADTQKILKEGMDHYPEGHLLDLLGYPDQRVRLAAQFEIVKRGDFTILRNTVVADSRHIARIHAIWACEQLVRNNPDESLQSLMPAIKHPDPEIRAQLVKALGSTRSAFALTQVVALLEDPEPRVRSFAAMALHYLAGPKELKAITKFLTGIKEDENFLRHAGVRALTGAARNWPELLIDLHSHSSQSVRLAGVIASRRLHEAAEEGKTLKDPDTYAGIAVYLEDLDEVVVAEAARAIHDMNQPSPVAMKRLAALLDRKNLANKALVVRAINANRWLGGQAAAQRLAAYAANDHVKDTLRTHAAQSLSTWLRPQALDLVLGSARPMPAHDLDHAHAALTRHLGSLLADSSQVVLNTIKSLRYQAAEPTLLALLADASNSADQRAGALQALIQLKSVPLNELMPALKDDASPELRRLAQAHLAKQKPKAEETIAMLVKASTSTDLLERQQAYRLLGELQATRPLREAMHQLIKGDADPDIQLDILEAAQIAQLEMEVRTYEKSVASDGPLAPYIWSLQGGHVALGEEIFKTSITAQCVRCHQLDGTGGEIGPDLTWIASRLTPEGLLSSLVTPQAEIADGYGTLSLTLHDDSIIAGTMVRADEQQLLMKEPDGTIKSIAKDQVMSQTAAVSSMPPMGVILSKRELRDLMAFLISLKSP